MKKLLLIAATFISFFVTAQNVGIGTTTPQSKLSVGANSQFQVDSIGNIKKINNVSTSFPTSQGDSGQVLTNNGSGNLGWGNISSLTKSGSVVMLDSYDTTLLNLGYTFIGKLPTSVQTKLADSSSWQWGSDISLTNASQPFYGHTAIWTGTEMIIWRF